MFLMIKKRNVLMLGPALQSEFGLVADVGSRIETGRAIRICSSCPVNLSFSAESFSGRDVGGRFGLFRRGIFAGQFADGQRWSGRQVRFDPADEFLVDGRGDEDWFGHLLGLGRRGNFEPNFLLFIVRRFVDGQAGKEKTDVFLDDLVVEERVRVEDVDGHGDQWGMDWLN